jgi:deoxyribonuclease IV
MGLLGAHESTAGGLAMAFERGAAIGCDALQIFVKNANAWRAKPLTPAAIAAFASARAATPGPTAAAPLPVIAHASYLINLASPVPDNADRSREAVLDELRRCDELGVDALVVHPGAHVGSGLEAGLDAIARALDDVLERHPEGRARLLLENTAGQGTVLGADLAHHARVLRSIAAPERIGICLDTCHAFAAGIDLRDPDAYEALLDAADAAVGLSRILAWHLNDSRFPLGSRKDRHANIGDGELGAVAFVPLLVDPRFERVPLILETPLGDDDQGHARDLVTLRELLGTPWSAS